MRPIHPFPARMTPDTVRQLIAGLTPKAVVLDPMCGSGMVVRHAAELGHRAIGFDIDPLAVLMSKVWTRRRAISAAQSRAEELVQHAKCIRLRDCGLPWIDECAETTEFTRYWFAAPQRHALRRLSYLLMNTADSRSNHLRDCLWLALSRIIVTKQAGASLAWDVSHSRPHKVREDNDFDVYSMFVRSAARLVEILNENRLECSARVRSGDARHIPRIRSRSIDAVITSPPYLNAIDYLRGHKLSLVWMGHTIPSLRVRRARSIGTEAVGSHFDPLLHHELANLINIGKLPPRQQNIVRKYTADAAALIQEMRRVIKPGGRMSLVLGDSNLRGHRVRNSRLFHRIAEQAGFELTSEKRRPLQENRRYLPIISKNNTLENRMRYEIIQNYVAA